MRPLTRVAVFGIPVLAGVLLYPFACPRGLKVPDATYRETVTAFYTGLAAMQTSQEVLARKEFERVTQLVPAGARRLGEPRPAADAAAGDGRGRDAPAQGRRAGARQAPRSQRLLALLESRKGRLPEAIRALEERDGGSTRPT